MERDPQLPGRTLADYRDGMKVDASSVLFSDLTRLARDPAYPKQLSTADASAKLEQVDRLLASSQTVSLRTTLTGARGNLLQLLSERLEKGDEGIHLVDPGLLADGQVSAC